MPLVRGSAGDGGPIGLGFFYEDGDPRKYHQDMAKAIVIAIVVATIIEPLLWC